MADWGQIKEKLNSTDTPDTWEEDYTGKLLWDPVGYEAIDPELRDSGFYAVLRYDELDVSVHSELRGLMSETQHIRLHQLDLDSVYGKVKTMIHDLLSAQKDEVLYEMERIMEEKEIYLSNVEQFKEVLE